MRYWPQVPPAQPTAEAAPSPPLATKKKALVVDKDAGVLAFAAEALSSFRPGFDVATAQDLEQATSWLDTFHPDLLLLGLEIPSGDIERLALRLRKDPLTSHCQIVVIAEKAPAEIRLNPGQVWAQAVLAKPLSLKSLLATVRRLT